MGDNPYMRSDLSVVAGSESVLIPYAPADRWIACVLSPLGPLGLLTGLSEPVTAERIAVRVLEGGISTDQASEAAYALLGKASPYKWWKTVRLLALSTREDIAGHMTLAGLDPHHLTVAQWVTAVYVLCTRNSDVKAKFKFDAPMDEPPAGVVDDEWMSEADFNAMVASARVVPDKS